VSKSNGRAALANRYPVSVKWLGARLELPRLRLALTWRLMTALLNGTDCALLAVRMTVAYALNAGASSGQRFGLVRHPAQLATGPQ
jgi:hypothetical protein